MTIKTEILDSGLVRTYSSAGMMIRQAGTGIEYAEAVDPPDSGRSYVETETPIPTAQLPDV